MAKKVVAIIGSYRKAHIIDSSVSAVSEVAAQAGAGHCRYVYNND